MTKLHHVETMTGKTVHIAACGMAFADERFVTTSWDHVTCKRCARSRPKDSPHVQEMEWRTTSFGLALYVRIYTPNHRQLSWGEIWEVFADLYPDQWAVQFFPPVDRVVDHENIYHLFVLDEPPAGMDIKRS